MGAAPPRIGVEDGLTSHYPSGFGPRQSVAVDGRRPGGYCPPARTDIGGKVMRTKRVVLAAVLGVFVAAAGGCGMCDCCGGPGDGPALPRSSGAFPAQPPAIGSGAAELPATGQ